VAHLWPQSEALAAARVGASNPRETGWGSSAARTIHEATGPGAIGNDRREKGGCEVGFFKRLSDKPVEPELEPLVLPGGEAVQVVGESDYQEALDAICGGKCEDGYQLMCQAELRPEPTTPTTSAPSASTSTARKWAT
jgi:hypothetical protein